MAEQQQGPQVDVGVVIKKLQDKLSEATTTIIILEAQMEALMEQYAEHDHEVKVEPEPNL